MAQIEFPDMEQLLPHRHPMILIDRMVAFSEHESEHEVTITERSPFLRDGQVPGFVGIEYMAQSIAAHGGYESLSKGKPVELGFLLGSRSHTLREPGFRIGQTLRIRVKQVWGETELFRFKCWIVDAASGEVVQEADMNVLRPQDWEKYADQAGAR